mmetsp:Transcript_23493/g.59024  ORF Transcript_23493/g.59024 Transcript_23493/m.59024 type:complete len:204 (+) Transcript_23493:403-1014(+)
MLTDPLPTGDDLVRLGLQARRRGRRLGCRAAQRPAALLQGAGWTLALSGPRPPSASGRRARSSGAARAQAAKSPRPPRPSQPSRSPTAPQACASSALLTAGPQRRARRHSRLNHLSPHHSHRSRCSMHRRCPGSVTAPPPPRPLLRARRWLRCSRPQTRSWSARGRWATRCCATCARCGTRRTRGWAPAGRTTCWARARRRCL